MSGHLALVVDRAGAALEIGSHDTVVLRHADGSTERVGLRALGTVVLHGNVKFSTELLRSLAAHDVALAMIPGPGYDDITAGFAPLAHRGAAMRHRQHLAYASEEQRLALARAAVIAKLRAMAEFALDHAPDAGGPFYRAMTAAVAARDLATLMGIEGAATARHFARLGAVYGPAGPFTFNGRSRQPPMDAPNALMSLAYALAQAEAVRLVLRAGLDVQVGFLHSLDRDRQSLALDLIEPARAPLDAWVHELLAQRCSIRPNMFTGSERGPVWLTKEGRSAFYPMWFRDGYRIALGSMRPLLARILTALRGAAAHSPDCADSAGAE